MCIYHGTRQRSPQTVPATIICRVQIPWHTAKIQLLPCARPGKHTAKILATSSGRSPEKFYRGSPLALGKGFAVCPRSCTRQRLALPMPVCRVPFAVCGTQQNLCRGLLGLCRVLWAHGKRGVSRSVYSWPGKVNLESVWMDYNESLAMTDV